MTKPEVRRSRISAEYLAGFVDAEGALMIGKTKSQRTKQIRYHARVTLSNTDREVLEDIQRSYSGLLFDSIPQKVHWKQPHVLTWIGESVELHLACVFPHLRVKRKQALVLLGFLRRMRMARSIAETKPGRVSYNLAELQALHERMKELNAKGPSTKRG